VDIVKNVAQNLEKKGQAVQCDLCGAWVHALCDGINGDQYKALVSLTTKIENSVSDLLSTSTNYRPVQIQAIDHDYSKLFISLFVR